MFKLLHTNINVTNLEKSLEFYSKALDLKELSRKNADDGSFTLVFLGYANDGTHQIELTCLKDHPQKYDLGENENHIAFEAADFGAAHLRHSEMNCICFENIDMGIYFIEDPDGYWLEIIPAK